MEWCKRRCTSRIIGETINLLFSAMKEVVLADGDDDNDDEDEKMDEAYRRQLPLSLLSDSRLALGLFLSTHDSTPTPSDTIKFLSGHLHCRRPNRTKNNSNYTPAKSRQKSLAIFIC